MCYLRRLSAHCLKYRPLLSAPTLRSRQVASIHNLSTDETPSLVTIEKREEVTLIGINRPTKRNCVNRETAGQLLRAFNDFETDKTSPVAVLHGNGGTFCAGYDLKELSETNASLLDQFLVRGPMGPTQMLTTKPIIGAIDGYAVAGGLELALLCDLRVVEENAIMGFFNRRFGVPLIDGATVRLQRLIGLSRALDLILTGRGLSAKEALEFGLANRVVAVGTALGQAYNLAKSLVKFPQECLKADRHSTYFSAFDGKSMEESLKYEFENGKPIISKESIEGANKFAEKGIGKHGKFVLHNFSYDVKVTV
ncbi:uncharacterized protein LOC128964235 [Oppia nitens]|uniref:uncharacterized protein LOC128964235 n=1 Tax=Oppia nitens TaxID=1686743 RepID=UPI0023DC9218|nr:uncharacterized protein LOC128964235 [Oppia nitens]